MNAQSPNESIAVVLAGGSGSRFGGPTPKQLMNLAGHPVLHHSLRRFERSGAISRLVVVANPSWRDEIVEICDLALRKVPYDVVDGGPDRNTSVKNAVATIDVPGDAKLLVHDGVRPLATEHLIRRVLDELDLSRCVLPIIPSADPLVTVKDGVVVQFEQRDTVFRGQSPQGFWLSDVRGCFGELDDVGVFPTVFEALAATRPDLRIGTVEGELNNLKVTTPIDRVIAGRLLLED